MVELFRHILELDFDWLFSNYGTAIYVILFLIISFILIKYIYIYGQFNHANLCAFKVKGFRLSTTLSNVVTKWDSIIW
mgnify:CR=1 FL=1